MIARQAEDLLDLNIPENPFPGLRPFEFHEALLYFGRDGQSEQLLRRLGTTRFLAVVGSSGSGKSSLVRAGLLPRLGRDVVAIYVESAAGQTELRLLRGLARPCPGLDTTRGLVDALAISAHRNVAALGVRLSLVILIGAVGGLVGGFVGQGLYGLTGGTWSSLLVFGWMLTGLLPAYS